MGTGMSMPKDVLSIGRSNRDAHNLYRIYNVEDHLFPYPLRDCSNTHDVIYLSVVLETFNSMVTQRLKTVPHIHRLCKEDLSIYKKIIDPAKILQSVITSNADSREVRIEVSPHDKQIYLCKTYLVEITDVICMLKDITILQMCCNYLRKLPRAIGEFQALKILILGKNRIISLPNEIGMCKELREIDVSFNLIKKLPKSLIGLKKLSTLQIEGNFINEIPCFLGKLKSLKYLNMASNPIKSIPIQVLNLPAIISINVSNCPLDYASRKFQECGTLKLKELVCRTIIREYSPLKKDLIPLTKSYLLEAKECSFCGGPYFDYFIDVIDVINFGQNEYPIFYSMCCFHYKKHSDRLTTLFEHFERQYESKIKGIEMPSVTELFEPAAYNENQLKAMNSGLKNILDSVPLLSLVKYNELEREGNTERILIDDGFMDFSYPNYDE